VSHIKHKLMIQFIPILMVPLDFLEKPLLLESLVSKSVFRSIHDQLPFLESKTRFQGMMNWAGATYVLHLDIPQNRIHQKRPCACVYLNLRWVSDIKNTGSIVKIQLRPIPINSSCLEIIHFRETATGCVYIG